MPALMRERVPLKRLQAGLPATWYHDPAHNERELEAFWYGKYVAVLRLEDLLGSGDRRTVRIGNQSVFLVKNNHGEIRAFHNTCHHRSSIQCTAESGSFARGGIVCPYHA